MQKFLTTVVKGKTTGCKSPSPLPEFSFSYPRRKWPWPDRELPTFRKTRCRSCGAFRHPSIPVEISQTAAHDFEERHRNEFAPREVGAAFRGRRPQLDNIRPDSNSARG